MLYFNESLRGLSVGAPVTLFGLRGGEVPRSGCTSTRRRSTFRPRVLVTFFPERLVARLTAKQQVEGGKELLTVQHGSPAQAAAADVEQRGLRAQLKSGSLLTGQLYVAFDYFPNAPKAKLDWNRDPLELPVVAGGFANIEAKLTSILDQARQHAARRDRHRGQGGARPR